MARAKRLGWCASCAVFLAACSNELPDSIAPGYTAGSGATAAVGGNGGSLPPATGSGATGAAGQAGARPPTPGTGGAGSFGGVAGAVSGAAGTAGGAAGSAGLAAVGGSGGVGVALPDGKFVNLAPMPSTPLTKDMASMPSTPAPTGWDFFSIPNTFCRDGSGNGIYMRNGTANKLLIYFEGGGACTTVGFCHFNPANIDSVLTGDGQSVLGTALAAGPGRQQPGVYNNGTLDGIFSPDNAENPYKDWNMVYVPYCTGDVHFGSNEAGMVPNLAEPQKFVGYKNSREFMSHIAPTFKGKVERVVVTGASAGSFGAALNFSMIADSFAGTRVDAVLDSGAPFEDAQWPACLQKSWRELWKMNDSFPKDCTECFNADGGGMIGLADFLIRKHPTGNIAAISSLHDEVIRLFFTPGDDNCATIATADPFEITLGQIGGTMLFSADTYEKGLLGLRAKYASTNRIASYYFAGDIDTQHQHTFRPRFYEKLVGGKSMAQFTKEFLDGTNSQLGP
jgi:hypothetical protein